MGCRLCRIRRAAAVPALELVDLSGDDVPERLLLAIDPPRAWVYPAAGAIDGLLAYGGRFTGVSVRAKEHPIHKVF